MLSLLLCASNVCFGGLKTAPGRRPASRQQKSKLPKIVRRSKYHNITHRAGYVILLLCVVVYLAEEAVIEVLLNLLKLVVIVNTLENDVVAVLMNA